MLTKKQLIVNQRVLEAIQVLCQYGHDLMLPDKLQDELNYRSKELRLHRLKQSHLKVISKKAIDTRKEPL